VDDDGRIPAWAPGTTGFPGDCLSEDDELRQLIEGVASAGSWAVWMGVFSRSWMELLVAGGLTYNRARIVTGKISAVITECRCAQAVLLRRFVMSGRPRKAQMRRGGDRNNWKMRYMSTMSVMGGRWAAVGNNRLTNFWRVVLRINDAICAGASERVEDDRAKAAEKEARVKELRARPRAGKERLTRISKGAIREWQGAMDGGRFPISQPKKKKRRKRLQKHKGLESGGCSVASFFSVAPPSSLGSSSHSPCADATSGARAAASAVLVARNVRVAVAHLSRN
jgi:hypothetical protein